MPELPDIVVYIEALERRIKDQTLERLTVAAPFLLRTAVPPIATAEGRKVVQLRRLGKRICIGLEEDLWLVMHLMIAGRLHWHGPPSKPSAGKAYAGRAAKGKDSTDNDSAGKDSTGKPSEIILSNSPKKRGLAAFQFSNGTLSLTEAGSQRRASLHVVEGEAGLQRLDPGGMEIFATDLKSFAQVLQSTNHTLKRALTDPHLFSGIGNAYSDEILFEARLSPIALTQKLTSEEIERLFTSTLSTLTEWVERLRAELGGGFPEKVTAFRPGMAVHGQYQKPCLRCGNKVQRIRYASNETNYCPNCQTAGKLLADRALSRLLRADWPKTIEELEGLTFNAKN